MLHTQSFQRPNKDKYNKFKNHNNFLATFLLIFFGLSLILLPCVLFIYYGPASETNSLRSRVNNRIEKVQNINQLMYDTERQAKSDEFMNIRVAMLIVYQGKSLPIWMETLSLTFHLSESIVDWIIISTNPSLYSSKRNIKFIHITEDDLCHRLTQLDPQLLGNSSMIKRLLQVDSYASVEFKPCLGFLFSDYLTGYSHWGYADIDQLFGRFDLMLSKQLLTEYDIYTSSFGDNFRAYMRGQFAVYRNNERVNNLWTQCPPYTTLKSRLLYFIETGSKKWYFESAEGCISKVVADSTDLKVYYASAQLSDASVGSATDIESIFLSDTLIRCNESPLPILPQFDSSFLFDLKQSISYDPSYINTIHFNTNVVSYDRYVAERLKYNCEYWVNPDYQVCLNLIPAHSDTILVNGNLTYSKFDRYKLPASECHRGGTTHFQGWKRHYYGYMTRKPPIDAHALIITEGGFVPLRISPEQHPPLSFRYTLYKHLYNTSPSGLPSPEIIINEKINENFHCLKFANDYKSCVCPISTKNDILMYKGTHPIKPNKTNKKQMSYLTNDLIITLAVTINLTPDIEVYNDKQLLEKAIADTMNSWTLGPKILAISITNEKSKKSMIDTSQLQSLLCTDTTLIVLSEGECATNNDIKDDHNIDSMRESSSYDFVLMNIALEYLHTDIVAMWSPPVIPSVAVHQQLLPLLFQPVSNEENSEHDNSLIRYIKSSIVTPFSTTVPISLLVLLTLQEPLMSTSNKTSLTENKLLSKGQTIIVFNQSASIHGTGWMKFPEELRFDYSYLDNRNKGTNDIQDTSKLNNIDFLRQLFNGNGYQLFYNFTANHHGDIPSFIMSSPNYYNDYGAIINSQNNSINVKLDNIKNKNKNIFIKWLKKFWKRSIALRDQGIQSVYSKQSFGNEFIWEQKQLYEKALKKS